MIDEKKLDHFEEIAGWCDAQFEHPEVNASDTIETNEMIELIRLARLGLWAEQHGVPAAKFYGTYSPRQHPEGYYEIHVAPGEGGEVRFGTFARQSLAALPFERGGV